MSIWSNLAQEFSKVFNDIPVIGKIPVVSDIIGGTIGQEADDYEANKAWNKQTGWQKEMAKYQNDFNAEQSQLQRNWSAEQSAINRDFTTAERLAQQQWQEKMSDPAYQIGRMLAAGISPAGFDGNQSVPAAVGSVPGMPQGSAAMASGSIGNAIPVLGADIKLKESQAALNNAQAEAVSDENERKNEMHPLELQLAGTNIKLAEFDLNEIRPAVKNQIDANTQMLQKSVDRIISEIDVNKAYELFLDKQGQLEQKKIDSYAQELQKRLVESDSIIRLNDANAKLAASRMAEAAANVYKLQQEGAYFDAQTKGQILLNGLTGLTFDMKYKNHQYWLKFDEVEGQAGYYTKIYELDTSKNQRDISYNEKEISDANKSYQLVELDRKRQLSLWRDNWFCRGVETGVATLGYPLGAGVTYSVGKQIKP